MNTTEKPFDIQLLLGMARRRKWYLIIPFVLSVLIAVGVYRYLPKVYKASALILVQPQRVPENYVRSTITDSVIDRLNTISQDILSRTRLERVIREFNLYSDLWTKEPMEEITEIMRRSVKVELKSQTRSQSETNPNAFSISYEGNEPRTVMMVANKLASLYIEENLRVREMQSEGTSQFLGKELSEMEEKLKIKEQDIRLYKERNLGHLPQQLDANLRILERLQDHLKTTSESIRAAEDRSVLFQTQLENLRRRVEESQVRRDSASGGEESDNLRIPEDPLITQWNTLNEQLPSLQSRYKDSHPDVISLKKRIAALEPKVMELRAKQEVDKEERLKKLRERVTVETLPVPSLDPETQRLFTHYTELYNASLLEAKRLREDTNVLTAQINAYRARIEDTPKREQELTLLTRDYDLMKMNYQSLLDKRIQAQMAQNLEMKQQSEQFKILDPAILPAKPIKPDRNKILLIGAFFGLVLGAGLAWFRESMDQSLRTVSDLEACLGFPVLATIPNLTEEKEWKSKGFKRSRIQGV